jgi:hypothetical protein
MNKKLLGSLSTLLAIAALLTTATAAQGATGPHWFGDGKLIGSESVAVTGHGEITLFGSHTAFCHAKDSEVIANPPGGGPGTDEVLTLRVSACTSSETPRNRSSAKEATPKSPRSVSRGLGT